MVLNYSCFDGFYIIVLMNCGTVMYIVNVFIFAVQHMGTYCLCKEKIMLEME